MRKSILWEGILYSLTWHCLSTILTSTDVIHKSELGQTTCTLCTPEFPFSQSASQFHRERKKPSRGGAGDSWMALCTLCGLHAHVFCWCLWIAHTSLDIEELQLHICKILQEEMDHSLTLINSLPSPRSVKENAVNASISILSLFLQNYNNDKKCSVFSVTKIGEVPMESVQLHQIFQQRIWPMKGKEISIMLYSQHEYLFFLLPVLCSLFRTLTAIFTIKNMALK